MSLETIKIHFQYPIVNGAVQLPNNLSKDKNTTPIDQFLADNSLTDIDRIRLTGGSGPNTGSKFGAQSFVRMPGVTPSQAYIQPE